MVEQRSQEWFKSRLGWVTASRLDAVMAKGKSGGYSATRKNYMAEKIVEILTDEVPESYTNPAMQWGTDTEPLAKMEYENRTFEIVQDVSFIKHPEIEKSGATPDGLIGVNGLIEIKCPNTSTHIDTLISEKIDRKYLLQMQFQMACTGRNWCDFVSYDPRLPDHLQMFIKRVEKDNILIAEIEKEIEKFLKEMYDKLDKLEGAK